MGRRIFIVLKDISYLSTGDRLGIREAKIDDGHIIVPWWSDPEVLHNYNIPSSLTPEKSWECFTRDLSDSTQFSVVAELLINGEIVAYLSLNHIDIDGKRKSADFCIIVSKPWRGKGIGYEASSLLFDCSFERFGILKIALGVWINNTAGFALFRKLGFRTVGTSEDKGYYQDPFVEYEMVLEKEDWISDS